ncbi:carboxypeptidase-like regulatory domain-containing protein [Blastopirellula sp. J2-11]|uniref:carboxypeptidase-like regulatory domain-containing protein n=1 Tax=Blastopirellula sp. J2-11 TaxID=2943192 RepID=UPI0021C9EB12|nr:carboxypeptidase-like regulatory domain-containing protein [Blastopirellula sp. J2-11]UUO08660.1 carboxypeptidase-like regulatory domain-containing protein [Blastopirellula sp. J2-11]
MRYFQLGAFMLLFAGCYGGSQLPNSVHVAGIVTLDGAPLEGATIAFAPEDAVGRSATSMTDEAGRFSMGTLAINDGVVCANYNVTIAKTEVDPSNQVTDPQAYYERTGRPAPGPKMTYIVPKKYNSVATSDLNVMIDEPRDDLRFELSSN